MNSVTWLYPAPSCTLPITHPARSVDLHDTNVGRTFEQYRTIRDDYELTDQLGYLEMIGDFK